MIPFFFKYIYTQFIHIEILRFSNYELFKELKRRKRVRKDIIIYLKNEKLDNEKQEILDFLVRNNTAYLLIPYDFRKKYNEDKIIVYNDTESNMRYVLHIGEKLFFPKDWKAKRIKYVYNRLLIEQDPLSPHCYNADDFSVEEGDIIADIGASEGIWALQNVKKAKKIYIFECDENWLEALKKTFEPWKEKTIIKTKYLSDNDEKNNIKLDTFLHGEEITYIKADIEGEEINFLKGSQEILSRSKKLRFAICAYHNSDDAIELEKILHEFNFSTKFSKGYIIPIWGKNRNLSAPYLRRGLVFAKNAY